MKRFYIGPMEIEIDFFPGIALGVAFSDGTLSVILPFVYIQISKYENHPF